MGSPLNLFISLLLIVDSFFVAYAVGLNSRCVEVPVGTASQVETVKSNNTSPKPDAIVSNTTGNNAPTIKTDTTASSFTDLSATDSRLQGSLKSAAEAGIFDPTKDQKFRPNDPVTRADFTRWMVRIKQIPTQDISTETPTYIDVLADNPYFIDIEAATRDHRVQGYNVKDKPEKEFKPQQFITRQEFAVMYGTFSGKRSRAESFSNKDIDEHLRYDPGTTKFGDTTFKDVGDIDDWAKKWVAVANQAGVLDQAFATSPYAVSEEQKYLHPQQKMTRAEAVNILVKLYGIGSRDAVSEPNASPLPAKTE
jgi:hypothetical protein